MPASKVPEIPNVKLASGANIPVIGLGTWKSTPGEVKQAVKDAIDVGYRHFDCALIYQNEDEVGQAFAEKIKDGVIKREDLFVTSKVWNSYRSRAKVNQAIQETLKSLQLEYLDLYLIHWPMSYVEDQGLFPKDKDGKMQHSDVDYLETWKEMEELVKAGKVKDIGLSNFTIEQIQRVLDNSTVPVSCLQIEAHVYLRNKPLIDFCKQKKIPVVAYAPLGSRDRPKVPNSGEFPPPLEDSVVIKIAEKHKKQPGHVMLKFLLQDGLIIIPKSVNKDRMKANLEVFDFELDKDDMVELAKLDRKGEYRACTMTEDKDHKHYPFKN